jgi:hypothetical protein
MLGFPTCAPWDSLTEFNLTTHVDLIVRMHATCWLSWLFVPRLFSTLFKIERLSLLSSACASRNPCPTKKCSLLTFPLLFLSMVNFFLSAYQSAQVLLPVCFLFFVPSTAHLGILARHQPNLLQPSPTQPVVCSLVHQQPVSAKTTHGMTQLQLCAPGRPAPCAPGARASVQPHAP